MKKAPLRLTDAPAPVTIELFASYAEAKAASSHVAECVEQILAVETIDGSAQESWVAERGREIAALRKAIDARRKKALAPLRAIEATIKSFDLISFGGEQIDAGKLLERCSHHLATILSAARRRAAEQQAALMVAATSAEEVVAAVAVVQPKPTGFVEVERWTWAIEDLAKVPPSYFVLDEARIAREAATQKGDLSIPGIRAVCERKGHFRS